MHFCMGELADISLFTTESGCEMKVEKTDCHKIEKVPQIENSSCCDDQSFQIDAEDEVLPIVKTSVSPFQFVQIAIFYAPELLASDPEPNTYIYHYTPPLIVRDISILNDIFLI